MRFPLPRLPFWAWSLMGIVVVLAAGAVLWLPRHTTSGAGYCLTCHGTGETLDVSQGSLVHPDYSKVGCVECHAAEPGLIITEGYQGGFSADPDLVSANCRRCHQDVVQSKQVTPQFNPLGIKVPHEYVPEEVFLQCTNCHRDIAHDLRNPATNRPHREYCYQCHSPTESCSKCHEKGLPQLPTTPPPPGEAPDGETLYAQYCAMCHGREGDAIPSVDLSSGEFLSRRTDESLIKSIGEGVPGMPAYSQDQNGPLTREEIKAIVEWLRSQGE